MHTVAPHCSSHCHQLCVFLTLQFLWRQVEKAAARIAALGELLAAQGLSEEAGAALAALLGKEADSADEAHQSPPSPV